MHDYMALTSNADEHPTLFVKTSQPLHALLDTAGYRIIDTRCGCRNKAGFGAQGSSLHQGCRTNWSIWSSRLAAYQRHLSYR